MPWQNNNSNGGGPWGGGGNNGGGRNPWGSGGGGPQRGGPQPPNIEDIIRRGQQQFKSALPGGLGGSGIILIILLLIAIWLGSTMVYRVNADQQGVVLRFGKLERTESEGLHFKLPAPIETVEKPQITKQYTVNVGYFQANGSTPRYAGLEDERLMLTGDENIVDIAFTVFWQIREAEKFLFNIQRPQEDTVKNVAESVMREVVGKTPIQDVLTERRAEIETEARELIQTVLTSYDAGIVVQDVKLQKVDPPSAVIDSFRDVQKAEADQRRYINQAEAYRNDIIPKARGDATRLIKEAEAFREETVSLAQGEAQRFLSVYEQYAQAKDVTKRRIYLETMEEILDGMQKIVIDETGGSGVVPYLPLPELQKNTGAR